MDLFMKTMLLVFPYGVAQKMCRQQELWDKMIYLSLKQRPVKKMFYKTKKYEYVQHPRKFHKILR